MPQNRTTYVIVASTLALIALFFLQVRWMKASHDLIEQQFNQKVRMALCFAVESLGEKDPTQNSAPTCSPVEAMVDGFQLKTDKSYDHDELNEALTMSLDFYDIDLDYTLDVLPPTSCSSGGSDPRYCCALSPFLKEDSATMAIYFPGKDQYIFDQMKFMLLSSIVILLFITLVFIFANHTLWRQKQIHQINKDFFNNMAHEFNTPLTNISLASNLLVRKHRELADDKFVKVVQEESEKLKSQVERVLHLGNLENGEYQLEKEALEIGQLLRCVIDGMALQIQEKNAVIEMNIPDHIPTVMGDRFHLGNVFRNLIDNALKYNTGDAKIEISLQNNQDGILILFQDNGTGISKKEQAFVFDKYHRASNGDLHDQKGFGLGLSYVKMIIERHRGFIKVISDLNKGCRFDLFIPVK